ncbi:hypothetical protein LDENG_00151990 [Lucifuga dentata]|nr:hypothetical protein LDENG_00151990 [Lucifuga dentata]
MRRRVLQGDDFEELSALLQDFGVAASQWFVDYPVQQPSCPLRNSGNWTTDRKCRVTLSPDFHNWVLKTQQQTTQLKLKVRGHPGMS